MTDITQKPDADALAKQYKEVVDKIMSVIKIINTAAVQVEAEIAASAKTIASAKPEEDPFGKLLEKYKDYTERRKEIEKKYDDDIAAMKAKNEDDKYRKNIAEAESQKQAALADFDTKEAPPLAKAASPVMDTLGDMSKKSVSKVLNASRAAESAAKYTSETDSDKIEAKFGFTAEQLKELKESPELLEKVKTKCAELNAAAAKKNSLVKLGKDFVNVFKSSDKFAVKGAERLARLGTSASESAKMIGGMAGDLGGMFSSLGNEDAAAAMTAVQDVMSAVSNIGEGFAKGGVVGGIGAAVGEIAKGLTKIFQAGDKCKEKDIKKLQAQVDALGKSYDKLGEAVEKAYSSSAKELIEDQNENLQKQNALIQQQIAKEQSKKNTDKEKIKAWKEKIEENNKLIEQNKEKAIDAIFGEDLKAAIENFASAYAEAWAKGGDKAEAVKDTVRKMMRQMVTESIKDALNTSEAMKNIRKSLEMFYADGVLSQWEQDEIYRMAEEVQKDLDREFGWADSLMKDEKEGANQQSASKGFETMSQETGSELNGRFTVMTDIMAKQLELQMVMKDASLSTTDAAFNIRDLVGVANNHLSAIRSNTNELYDIRTELKTIRENTAYLK